MNTQTGIEKWHELDGDNTLALDWPLNEDSHVWEIGGFEGRWAQQIWDKFHCHITIFEPQLWAAVKMKERFKGIEKIDIRPYGLWIDNQVRQLGNYHTDGASLVNNDGREATMPAPFKNIITEIVKFGDIDLALMNIEGAEYTLIPELIDSETIDHFGYFWCQFHPESDEIDEKAMHIFKALEETHDCIWNCYPTAVAWKKR